MGWFGQNVAQGLGLAVRSSATPLLLGLRWARRGGAHEQVPRARWNIGVASKAALDEAFIATEFVLADLASRSTATRFANELPTALSMFRDRGWLADPSSYHEDPPAIGRVRSQLRRSGWLDYRHIRFASGYKPHAGEPGRERWLSYVANRTAHAWILEHRGAPRPWLVCVPGYRMGHPLVDFTGFRARWLHRELGLNIAIPVMPLHGPRRQGRRGGDGFFSGDFIDTVHAHAQAVWDTRRLFRWLRDRGAPKLGIYGISLGGHTTSLFVGLERSIDCVIAGVPAVDFLRLVQSQMPDFVIRLAGWAGYSMHEIGELLRVVSPLALKPRGDRKRRFIYAGLADQLATPDHALDLWNHWQRPRVAWYQGSHISFLWEKVVGEFVRAALTDCEMIS